MEAFFTTDVISDGAKAALGAAVIGLAFGFFSQRSEFCLRAATIEFWSGRIGGRFAIWLVAFGTAFLSVQLLIAFGMLPVEDIRQLASVGSLSGAIIGGTLFGSGMILARGCASRILVLSATGNMRTLMTGLLLTVVAQSSLRGILSPLREKLSALWLIQPGARDLSLYLPQYTGIVVGLLVLVMAVMAIRHSGIGPGKPIAAAIVGLTIAAGWLFTAELSAISFENISIQSITFTGPSANTLMALINEPSIPMSFGIGLVPGVFVGSFVSSVLSRTFEFQCFNLETGTRRYIIGAVMMGFGGMLAGGCAVGAGLTGGSVFSLTALIALTAMWFSAGLTDMVVDREGSATHMAMTADH
jgi:uncharacterized membrane protein YedE/YeeE